MTGGRRREGKQTKVEEGGRRKNTIRKKRKMRKQRRQRKSEGERRERRRICETRGERGCNKIRIVHESLGASRVNFKTGKAWEIRE